VQTIRKTVTRKVFNRAKGWEDVALRVRGLEGVVSKRRDAPYKSGECRDWRTQADRPTATAMAIRATTVLPEPT
jgi:ATP-dependent DNA ligase